MSNLPINYHSFEINKNKIKAFSNTLPAPIELKAVAEEGTLWFDHRVTGAEFNSAIKQVQKAFRENNDVNKKIIKEFGVIYEAFESLDKDYIQGIKSSVASADKSSKQALEACEKARVAREEIKKTQIVLIKNVKNLQGKIEAIDSSLSQKDAAIENLSEFINSEIAQQKQLRDKMISGLELYQKQIAEQNRTVLELKDKIASFTEHYRAEIEEQIRSIAELDNKIDSYAKYFTAKTGEQNRNIVDLNRKIDSYAEKNEAKFDTQSKTITELSNFINFKLEQQRVLNNKVASDIEEHKAQLEEQNKTIAKLTNKIKYAYIVSAIAIAIACVHFFIK